jgi:asparagine synthase (glutamine-hydrolysing)
MVLSSRLEGYDESIYIDQIVAALRFQSFRAEFSSAWLKANIDRISQAQEEPVAGMAVAGQFLAYETAAHHGARVVLDGQGADEIFAGYPRHQHTVLKDYLRRRALSALWHEVISLWRRDARFFGDLWRLRILPRLAHLLAFEKGGAALDFLQPQGGEPPSKLQSESPEGAPWTALGKELSTDVLTGNLRPVLAVTDRNAMAHSIEARVPFVDRRIVEFAFRLPDNYKIGDGKRKRILRLLAERYLPKSIVTRVDRIGFGAPIEQWLRTDFRTELLALPGGDVFGRSTLVDPLRLGAYINEFLAGQHHDAGTIWRLFGVDRWARVYSVRGI